MEFLKLELKLFYTFKYHVSCSDGKISVTNIYFYYRFFHCRPTHKLCFLSCRPFVINATFSTSLIVLDLLKMSRLQRKAYRKENTTYERDDGGKIGNKNK